MNLRRYVVRRLLQFLPILFFIVALNFFIIHIAPGDPAIALGGENATPKQLEAVRQKYGLNRPLGAQFLLYINGVSRGDLGYSYGYGGPVAGVILEKVFPTLVLVLTSAAVAIVGGVVLGTYAANHARSAIDWMLSTVFLLFYAAPVFWVGLLLVLVFSVQLRWLPTSGMTDFTAPQHGMAHWVDIAKHLILPVSALSAYFTPVFFRLARASVGDVMREHYIVTARAKGLAERRILYHHTLRNALQSVVAMAGLWLGVGFTGSVLVETVFGWPGMGRVLYQAIFLRDYPLLMGIFLFMGVSVIAANLVADIVNALIDPRVVYS